MSATTATRSRARSALSLVGVSRHSALPALRDGLVPTVRSIPIKAGALICGSTLIGVAVAMLVEADYGLAPYDVLSSGLGDQLGISLGQAGWAVAAVLFAAAALLGRRPSRWGIAYILTNGITIDATSALFTEVESTLARMLFVAAGIVVMAAGINLVLFSGTTGGPFELLMAAGEDRGVSPLKIRYGLDVSVLVLGLVLGGAFGLGTVVYAATMGLVLQVTRQVFADYKHGRELRQATSNGAVGSARAGEQVRER